MKKILRDYQLSATRYLRAHNGGALFIEMRLGKTLITIRFLQMRSNVKRVIIVAPYSAFTGWTNEKANIKCIDLHSEKVDYETKDGWYLINKEAHLKNDFLKYQWDAIVLDESFIKNPKAKVTKYFLNKSKRIPIRILLTGTPAPENEMQYYTQLAFLFPGVFKVKNFWEYRARYARPYGFEWRLTPQGMQILEKTLIDNCFVLRCKDVELYPNPVCQKRYIRIDLSEYRHAERNCLDDMDNILKFAGQRWNYLRRLCSGKEKENELLDLLNGELYGKTIVIWAVYIEEVIRLSKLLKCPYITGQVKHDSRKSIIDQFMDGRYRHIVIQPETQKFGSDLSIADTEIYFSTPQGLETRQQSERRLIDLKRNYPVLIVDLIAERTIEEDIIESLYNKESRQKLLERVRNGVQRRNY